MLHTTPLSIRTNCMRTHCTIVFPFLEASRPIRQDPHPVAGIAAIFLRDILWHFRTGPVRETVYDGDMEIIRFRYCVALFSSATELFLPWKLFLTSRYLWWWFLLWGRSSLALYSEKPPKAGFDPVTVRLDATAEPPFPPLGHDTTIHLSLWNIMII